MPTFRDVDPQIVPALELLTSDFEKEITHKPYKHSKATEGSDNVRGVQLLPKDAASPIWGWKAQQASYALEVADRFPAFGKGEDAYGKWQVGFCYRPGPRGMYYDSVLKIVQNFAQKQNDQDPNWCFVVPRGHTPKTLTRPWAYLHLLRRYRRCSPEEVARDLQTIITGTYGQISALEK